MLVWCAECIIGMFIAYIENESAYREEERIKKEKKKEASEKKKFFLSGLVVMGMLVITEWEWCLETQHTALPTHTCKIPWAWSIQRPNSYRHSYKHKHMCAHTPTHEISMIGKSRLITGLNCPKNLWIHSKNSSYAKCNIAFCWIIICNYLFVSGSFYRNVYFSVPRQKFQLYRNITIEIHIRVTIFFIF